ncbi:hypothetical protein D6D01_06502 [Aureobasidium pullulans]|uniref:Cerato-platanin n=1 Tax=Aureobasidium pullulans TaxID=5580 RepID=A0A4S9KYH3_AURPU|nr:hypothetical protein D6D01_06502 [Aureobasidium pullulans]
MQFSISTILSVLAATAAALPTEKVLQKRGTISATPHVEFSSSVGVLGCKINTNRVAYWPMSVGCDNMCVKVSHQGRSLHLLRVDQSGGAYDMSYDAWNTLVTGQNATVDPTMGGGVDMEYESVDMDQCSHLLHDSDGKLAFSAANSMNFIASCISEPNSWVAKNYGLWNIYNSICTNGVDEQCTLDLNVSNQPSCGSSVLGINTPLTTQNVTNIAYGTGKAVAAV